MRTPCQTVFLTFSCRFCVAAPGGRHGGTWRPPALRHVGNLAEAIENHDGHSARLGNPTTTTSLSLHPDAPFSCHHHPAKVTFPRNRYACHWLRVYRHMQSLLVPLAPSLPPHATVARPTRSESTATCNRYSSHLHRCYRLMQPLLVPLAPSLPPHAIVTRPTRSECRASCNRFSSHLRRCYRLMQPLLVPPAPLPQPLLKLCIPHVRIPLLRTHLASARTFSPPSMLIRSHPQTPAPTINILNKTSGASSNVTRRG